MEDFFYAGGLPRADGTVFASTCISTAITVTGTTVGENIEGAQVFNDDVIRRSRSRSMAKASLAVLKGNLAPDGCVIKPAAMDPAVPQALRARDGVRRLSVDEEGGWTTRIPTSPPTT